MNFFRNTLLNTLGLVLIASQFAYAQEHDCAYHKMQGQDKKKVRTSPYDAGLMAKYDIHFCELDLHAENDTVSIDGHVTIHALALQQIDTFAFELHSNHTVDSVLYNGNSIPVANNTHIRYVPQSIASGTDFAMTIYYHGNCPSAQSAAIGSGFSTDNSPSWGNKVTWSLSQPYVAYEWWPCKQALTDKIDSSAVSVRTTLGNRAGSQGLLQSVDTTGNQVKYNWFSREKIDYYLISIAVAEYIDYSYYINLGNGDSVLYQNYVYNNPNTLPNFKNTIDTCGLMVKLFSDKVVKYPFYKEKYGHCMAPFGGGMEHQTMTSLGSFNFDLVAHELFHQWYGDYVTCKTWKDIWINEGFARYGEVLAREWLRGPISAANKINQYHNNIKTSIFGSVYFTDTADVDRIFDSRLTYNKGGAIIHTLRFILGDSAFFQVLSQFPQQYAYSNASFSDFKLFAENLTGVNLTDWANQWFYGQGWPIYNMQYNSNGNQILIRLKHATSNSATPLFKTPVQITLNSASGDTTLILPVNTNDEFYMINSNKMITNAVIDPNNWVIDSTSSISKNDLLFPTDLNEIKPDDLIKLGIDQLKFHESLLGKSAEVLSVDGKLIQRFVVAKKVYNLSDLFLSNGIYFIQIGDIRKKILK
jgi:aminopeptidase N